MTHMLRLMAVATTEVSRAFRRMERSATRKAQKARAGGYPDDAHVERRMDAYSIRVGPGRSLGRAITLALAMSNGTAYRRAEESPKAPVPSGTRLDVVSLLHEHGRPEHRNSTIKDLEAVVDSWIGGDQ